MTIVTGRAGSPEGSRSRASTPGTGPSFVRCGPTSVVACGQILSDVLSIPARTVTFCQYRGAPSTRSSKKQTRVTDHQVRRPRLRDMILQEATLSAPTTGTLWRLAAVSAAAVRALKYQPARPVEGVRQDPARPIPDQRRSAHRLDSRTYCRHPAVQPWPWRTRSCVHRQPFDR